MTSFVLETYVPGGSHDRFTGDVDGLQRAADPTSQVDGVRYLASYLVPSDEMGFHLLEARSARDVERVASQAGIEAERIVEAVDVASGRWLPIDELTRKGAT